MNLSQTISQTKLATVVGLAVVAVIIGVLALRKSKGASKQIKKLSVKLVEKKYITHDTVIFTFLLPDSHKQLGLNIGQHIEIEALVDGVQVNRKYTPISRIDTRETFQLLIKIYNKCEKFPEGGILTQYLDSLNIDQNVNISLPYGRYNYLGNSSVQITSLDKKVTKKKYKNFFMIAGGTGITPLYQIIQYISENEKEDQMPNVTLLFANRSEDDILLEKELLEYQKRNNKFNVYFSVDKSIKEGWSGFEGFINQEKIDISLGAMKNQIEETLFLSCGPPILSNIVEKIWFKELKVKPENMFRF